MKIYTRTVMSVITCACLCLATLVIPPPARANGYYSVPSIFNSQQYVSLESWKSCNSLVCIDDPPHGPAGLDGSGGWGWNSKTNSPVLTLTAGKTYTNGFTVTLLQPNSIPVCGYDTTITLTFSSEDFRLNVTDSGGNIGSNPFTQSGNQWVFTYPYATTGFSCHTAQSISYTFTALNPTDTAIITATINVGGQTTTESFPIQIAAKEGH
jgi:hypothetical protein